MINKQINDQCIIIHEANGKYMHNIVRVTLFRSLQKRTNKNKTKKQRNMRSLITAMPIIDHKVSPQTNE